MSALAIVIGSLFKMPEQRVSKSGKPYITASLKVKDGAELQWWRVTAFSETAQTELMRLVAGDALAVQGPVRGAGAPRERLLAAASLPCSFLTPSCWKRAVGLPPGRNKDESRAEAIRRWPAQAELFARKRDDGRAEAALIAVAGLLRKGGAP